MLVPAPLLVDDAEVDPAWLAAELLSAGLVLLGVVELCANAHRPEQSRVTATRISLRMGNSLLLGSGDEVEQELETRLPERRKPVLTTHRGAQ